MTGVETLQMVIFAAGVGGIAVYGGKPAWTAARVVAWFLGMEVIFALTTPGYDLGSLIPRLAGLVVATPLVYWLARRRKAATRTVQH